MAEIELEGDWYCPKCHKTNFARRTVCFACKAPKLGSQTGGGGVGGGNADRMLEGDWRCGDCGFHNFAKRDRCFGCNGSRYAPSLKGETMLKGDWICIHCKEHNFARRTVCFNCKVPRNTFTRAGYGGYVTVGGGGYGGGYGGGGRGGIPQAQPGDWMCSKCSYVNFMRRVNCFSCHTSKEAGLSTNNSSETTPKPAPSVVMEGDWTCPKCNENNFARRIVCFKCRAQKPGLDLVSNPSQLQTDEGGEGGEEDGEGDGEGGEGEEGETQGESAQVGSLEGGGHDDINRDNQEGGESIERTEGAGSASQAAPSSSSHATSPSGTKPAPQMLEGDWICSKCSEHNFARRTVCFACSLPRNPSTTPYAGIGRGLGGRGAAVGGRGIVRAQPDDWICLQCQGHNFAWRVVCFNCGTPKISRRAIVSRGRGVGRGRGRGGGGGGAGVIAPGDWICQACRSHNFARRQDCFSCGNAK